MGGSETKVSLRAGSGQLTETVGCRLRALVSSAALVLYDRFGEFNNSYCLGALQGMIPFAATTCECQVGIAENTLIVQQSYGHEQNVWHL